MATDAEARAAKVKVLKKDPGSKGFKFFRAVVDQIKDTRAGKGTKPAAKTAGKKALRTVNPSSSTRKSSVMKTVKRPSRSNKKRSKGAGIQT